MAIDARIIRPDGTYSLTKTWRRRLGRLKQPRDQRDALRLFEGYAQLTLANRRQDRIDRERAAFRLLVCRADWRTMTSCTTREQMAEVVNVCLATISTYLAAWLQAGLIRVVLDPLSPAAARGRGKYAGAGRAPIYGLTSPPELAAAVAWWASADLEAGAAEPDFELSAGTYPEVNGLVDKNPNPTHVSASSRHVDRVVPKRRGDNSTLNNPTSWPGRVVPTTGSERLLAVSNIIERACWHNRTSGEKLAEELAPFFAAGWCVNAVIWALDHHPDGAQRINTTRVRHPVGWVRHRLASWKTADGVPLSPPIKAAALVTVPPESGGGLRFE